MNDSLAADQHLAYHEGLDHHPSTRHQHGRQHHHDGRHGYDPYRGGQRPPSLYDEDSVSSAGGWHDGPSVTAEDDHINAISKRLMDVKGAAQDERRALLRRIEELSDMNRQLQQQLGDVTAEADVYRTAIGSPRNVASAARATQQDIVRLHSTIREGLEREAQQSERIWKLEALLHEMRGNTKGNASVARLVQLQERLSHAHMTRKQTYDELTEVQRQYAVAQAQEGGKGAGVGVADLFRLRGHMASLRQSLQHTDNIVRGLTDAVEEAQKLRGDSVAAGGTHSAAAAAAAALQPCPWCKQIPSSPYCPITGSPHVVGSDDASTARIAAKAMHGMAPHTNDSGIGGDRGPPAASNVSLLIDQLRKRDEENSKLRQLLSEALHKLPSEMGGRDAGDAAGPNAPLPTNTRHHMVVTTLQQENDALNGRCAELLLEVEKAKASAKALEADLKAEREKPVPTPSQLLLMTDGESRAADRNEIDRLRQEIAVMNGRLLREEVHRSALEAQLRRTGGGGGAPPSAMHSPQHSHHRAGPPSGRR